MKKIIYYLLCVIFSSDLVAGELHINYPDSRQELCRNIPIVVKWTGSEGNVSVEIKKEADANTEYKSVVNYQINENTFLWTVNDADYLNVPLSIRVSDLNTPTNFDEFHGITVFSETNIISQTNSLQLCGGEDIDLQVDVLGYNLKYQWLKDSEEIAGATSSILLIPNAEYSNSGTYVCKIISDSPCETFESKPISVYVATKTMFLANPKNVFWEYQYNGKMNAEIHANINDSNNVKFQWYKDTTIFVVPEGGGLAYPVQIRKKLEDGKKYAGTQSQDFVVKNMIWGDRAEYYCVAEGLCGTDTAIGMIGAQKYFRVKKISPDFYGCEGSDVSFKASLETNETGTFTFQWYKTGKIMLEEGEKYSGTQTLNMTIHNADRKDNSTYYVLVTLVEKDVYDRCEEFTYDPKYKPFIADQMRDWVIFAPRDYEYGRIYLKMSLYNLEKCYFEWYKGDSLISKGLDQSVYRFKEVEPSNVGWYKCKIRNNCGTIWSDSIYVAWGFENNRFSACMNDELVLIVDKFSDDFYFEWVFKGKIIEDSFRIANSKTNHLTFTRLDENDAGDYSVYVINKNTKNKLLMGIVKVTVELPPDIVRDFPDTLSNIDDKMPLISIVAISKGKGLNYILYIDGEAQNSEQFRKQDIYGNIDYGFVMGGNNSNLKPGVYQYRFRNECGITWSNRMTVINAAYKPGGIIEISSDNPDENSPTNDANIASDVNENLFDNDLLIYPNPTSDFITITISNKGLQPFVTNDSPSNKGLQPFVTNEKVQIFDMLGIEVSSTGGAINEVDGGGLRIDISHLAAGMYFIRIGTHVEKFVKI